MSQSNHTSSSILEKIFEILDDKIDTNNCDEDSIIKILKDKCNAIESIDDMIIQNSEQDDEMRSDIFFDQLNNNNNNNSDDEMYECNEFISLDSGKINEKNGSHGGEYLTFTKEEENLSEKNLPCEMYSGLSIYGKDSKDLLINESGSQIQCSSLTKGQSTSGLVQRIISQLHFTKPVMLYVLNSLCQANNVNTQDYQVKQVNQQILSYANVSTIDESVNLTQVKDETEFNEIEMKPESETPNGLSSDRHITNECVMVDLNKRKRKQCQLEDNSSCLVSSSLPSHVNECGRKKTKKKNRRKKKGNNKSEIEVEKEGEEEESSSKSKLPLCDACMDDGIKKNSIIDHLLWMEMSCLISITNIAQIDHLMGKDDAETASQAIFESILSEETLLLHHRLFQSKYQFDEGKTRSDLNSKSRHLCQKHRLSLSSCNNVFQKVEANAPSKVSNDCVTVINSKVKGHKKKMKNKGKQGKVKDKTTEDKDEDEMKGLNEIELVCYAISAIRSLIDQKLISLSLDQVKLFDSFIKGESFLHKRSHGQCNCCPHPPTFSSKDSAAHDLNEVQSKINEQLDWLKILSIKILGSFATESCDLFISSSICKLFLGLLEEESFVTSASQGTTSAEKGEGKSNSIDLKLNCRNLRIRCELIDNLMDMFSSDNEKDSLIKSNNLLERFSLEEKILSEKITSFNLAKRQLNQNKFKSSKKCGKKFETFTNNSGSFLGISVSDDAVIQTVSLNFKRFIRYKVMMLSKSIGKKE